MATSDECMEHVMENLDQDHDFANESNDLLDMCMPFCDEKPPRHRYGEGDEASDASTAATTPPLDTAVAPCGRSAQCPTKSPSSAASTPATPSVEPLPPVVSPQTSAVADAGGLFEAYCRAGAPVTSPYLQLHQITRRRCAPAAWRVRRNRTSSFYRSGRPLAFRGRRVLAIAA